MARTALTVQTIIQAGLNPSYVAANTDGHSVVNNGNTFIALINSHTTTQTATVEHPGMIDGLTVADQVVAVAASQTRFIGPFSARFNQPGTQDVYINFAAVTSLSAAAFRIG